MGTKIGYAPYHLAWDWEKNGDHGRFRINRIPGGTGRYGKYDDVPLLPDNFQISDRRLRFLAYTDDDSFEFCLEGNYIYIQNSNRSPESDSLLQEIMIDLNLRYLAIYYDMSPEEQKRATTPVDDRIDFD